MSKVEDFLTASHEEKIVAAIKEAEKNTSGEIRVHIEHHSGKDPLDRAKEVFYFLNMDRTQQQNGVLFYVAVNDKKFSVIGDSGINKVVPDNFWESVKNTVLSRFKTGNYAEGLIQGILAAGEKLKEYFPYTPDDKNELPDNISLG